MGPMLILLMTFLTALFGVIWGFMMCFLPEQWDRLTEAISCAPRWTVPSPKRLHPIIRLGNRLAGVVICLVGCWFVYVAASGIYAMLRGQAVIHNVHPSSENLANSPTTIGNVFSLLMIVAGIFMALMPAKAMMVFESVWPAARRIEPSVVPKVILLVRVLGAIFALLAVIFLVH